MVITLLRLRVRQVLLCWFSYIGMQSQAHEVSAKTGTLNVRLVSDAALIDEVVVVAYGTRKKGRLLVPFPL